MRFSEKYGGIDIQKAIQLNTMDEPLRNGLWNVLQTHIWDNVRGSTEYFGTANLNNAVNRPILLIFRNIWLSFFKRPVDELETDWRKLHPSIKQEFYAFKWHEVYDFIEFLVQQIEAGRHQERIIRAFNLVLQQECSAYRFVGNTITNISEENELDVIRDALMSEDKLIENHLKQSLIHLSNRVNPDYRNSMKEAISALERFVVLQASDEKDYKNGIASLIERSSDHKAFQKALKSLYGYASDAEGIRHFLKEEVTITYADAKYFLVLCSSLIMWLRQKNNNC